MSALLDETEDVALNFGEEDDINRARKKNFKHPIAIAFHLLFRTLAILSYLFCGLFISSFITKFVLIIILLSMDFWTVKNITGRLLVGLRWWNNVDDSGKSQWIFESRKGTARKGISTLESNVFWISLVVSQVIWVLYLIGSLFTLSLKWSMVASVGIGLNGANLYGFIQCKIGSKKKLSTAATNFLGQQVFQSLVSRRSTTKVEDI